ncbi:MAG: hypothetical protein HY069_03915 [Chlamydiia bacterium]|nr:hypothetical protein [Chlamydiia bacterium]
MRLKFLPWLLSFTISVFAEPPPPDPVKPWFTGSLIAPVGQVVPRGHFDVRSFIFMQAVTGIYDNDWHLHSRHQFYTFNPQIVAIFGLTQWMDLQITPQFVWNCTHGQNSIHVGDFPLALDFQLYPANKSWFPGVKFTVQETFPIGKYKNLGSQLYATDASGKGTYATEANLLFYQVYHLHDVIFLSTTLNIGYTFTTPVHLSGFNAYGGGYGTHGKLDPGNVFTALFAFEYSFDRNWAFAMDTVYTHTQGISFTGHKGTTKTGAIAVVGNPESSDLISFSPSVEYNFNETFGICFGCYFSAFGRNTQIFRTGVVNLAYAY